MLVELFQYLGKGTGIAFATLCLASGLYYCAEFIEENTVLAKKILIGLMQTVGVLHVLMLMELSVWRTLFSLLCLGCYMLVLLNHFSWFQYFSKERYPVSFVASWFGIGVWMVPFLFFISTCANDATLPAFGS
ncbi:transmembrane adaptor Erv26-domain-containing protein [Gorgonomyces haynaldii]|nr:transmembrane adaptor Erv26-domain-containing protein [Gorgonomyces haynaldii]